MRRVSVIILAAGGSSRLGKPKQLLEFQGRSLVVRAAQSALRSAAQSVVIVLGAYSDAIEHELRELNVTIARNSKWQTGMGSSIKVGLDALSAMETASAGPTNGVLLMLGDQPFITATHLNELMDQYSIHGGIVASAYCNTLGAPVVFGPEFHQELASLEPGQGAKCVIDRHLDFVKAINCAAGVVDIDTQEDYDQLVKSESLMLFERPGMIWLEGAD